MNYTSRELDEILQRHADENARFYAAILTITFALGAAVGVAALTAARAAGWL